MHIPDGFLDLSICLVAYVISLIFWIFAFKKAKKELHERLIPLMATLTAMFFAAQMMNYPIIGGTTAHLLGGPLLAVTLGPYAGLISMTIILLIQALFFGDGGITTFGANVLNMGIVGVFIPYIIYIVTMKISNSKRSVLFGVFLAALLGDVFAAIFAGFELGLSTTTFPYGILIAVTMMATHHSIIGVGEGLATTVIISILLKTRPDLLNLPKLSPSWLGKPPDISTKS